MAQQQNLFRMRCPDQKQSYNCVSRREHFNYLRNNSCGMSAAFTWGTPEAKIQDQQIDMRSANQYYHQHGGNRVPVGEYQHNQYQSQSRTQQNQQQATRQNKRVTFDDKPTRKQGQTRSKSVDKSVLHETNQRPPKTNFQRSSKLEKDEQGEKLAAEQRRQKVQNYIQEQRPFSRGMSNSKFQQYYNKAAPECYGRANTNEPIGGIIYGNHLKTFNVNPHAYTNNPEHYQTHTTALNYGKRTKINDQERWKKLERELSKKLGLKEKNQTIKQGKQVVYVDVDDSNMYQVMKENHEFQKANREQIHAKEVQFKKEKHQAYLDDINQFYAKKQDLIAEGVSLKNASTVAASDMDPEEYEARLNQQTIYRHHDKNGNVRLGADRHALTCFVDLNFPENDALYTEELKNRMPIYPTKCEGEDRNIDDIRRENYYKSKDQPYPSHYLLRNCEEPEVLKMLSEKTGVKLSGRKTGGNTDNRHLANSQKNPRGVSKAGNKSFASTANSAGANRSGAADHSFNYQSQQQQQQYQDSTFGNKSELVGQAWRDRQLAGDISNGMNQTCCVTEHLPHNEKNPQCYRNTTVSVGRIPFAG